MGQRFIKMLESHPFFELTIITASEKKKDKEYEDVVHWRVGGDIPSYVKKLKIKVFDLKLFKEKGIRVVFSALPPDIAKSIEKTLAENGFAVFSNSRAFRLDESVPILIPEVNPEHIQLIEAQLKKRSGFIVTNPNCSTTGLAIALKPLTKFKIRKVIVSTYQALSGAGYPGIPSTDILSNVIPFIGGEEERIQVETKKILGEFENNKINNKKIEIIPSCTRVPVKDGHLESVVVEFEDDVSLEDIKKEIRKLSSIGNLPTSPSKPLIIKSEDNRPQPILDVYAGQPERAKGMSVTVGRFKKQKKQIRFFLLVHNTIRGAAGNSILNAEYAMKKGYLSKIGDGKK